MMKPSKLVEIATTNMELINQRKREQALFIAAGMGVTTLAVSIAYGTGHLEFMKVIVVLLACLMGNAMGMLRGWSLGMDYGAWGGLRDGINIYMERMENADQIEVPYAPPKEEP